ncbi:uncharacterized protein LOC135464029 [Liolophura sinensis]|uniref:uncharacterized protein LOC135464029 n=1 Tax=Liolophura sinensis TaxID=3198878 RepID=UPI003158BA4F
MSIQYTYRQLDEVSVDDLNPSTVSEIYHSRVQPEGSTDGENALAQMKWPRVVGIVQIINGFITGFLGVAEVFLIPILEDIRSSNTIVIGKRNCYMAGIFAGIMMLITGSTAVRSSISQRGSTIQRYMILLILSIAMYTAFSGFLISGYIKGWTEKDKFPEGSSLYEVHIFVTASTLLGLMFVVAAFIQYFQAVCFGEIQLFKRALVCCLPCLFKVKNNVNEGNISNIVV